MCARQRTLAATAEGAQVSSAIACAERVPAIHAQSLALRTTPAPLSLYRDMAAEAERLAQLLKEWRNGNEETICPEAAKVGPAFDSVSHAETAQQLVFSSPQLFVKKGRLSGICLCRRSADMDHASCFAA